MSTNGSTGTPWGEGQTYGAARGEYTYRFNLRHDVPRLFHRALVARALAPPARHGILQH